MTAHDAKLREHLTELADRADLGSAADPAGDLQRGARALRRRSALRAGWSALAVVAVVGAVATLGPGDGVTRTELPAAGRDGTAPPSVSASQLPSVPASVTPSPSPGAGTASPGAGRDAVRDEWITRQLRAADRGVTPFKAWRDGLFATSKDVLDPGGHHLDYATDSLQSGYGSAGVSLGVKLGWTNPGERGQGLVMVAVSSGDPTGEGDPCFSVGVNCLREQTYRGVRMHLSDDGATVYGQRPDGLVVMVHVELQFGNNSSVGVDRMPLTEADLFTLVLDPRIDLPRPPSGG